MRRTTSNTQQRTVSTRPLRRVPSSSSSSGVHRRNLIRTATPRANSITDMSRRRDMEEIDNEIHIEENEHDRQVLEALNNINESLKEKSEIISIIKDIKDNVDIIKTHTPRKDPEYEVEIRDLLIDIRDEMKGMRKDICNKSNDTVNSISGLKDIMITPEPNIPLHRRDPINKSSTDVVSAIRELKTVIQTPRGGSQDNDRANIEQTIECRSSMDKIVSRLDELISTNKESREVYRIRKEQDTNLFTAIKDAIDKKSDIIQSTDDYEQKYETIKNVHETQFFKFSKILAMYHNAMLTLCRSDNPEAEEEFRKLQELVGDLTDQE